MTGQETTESELFDHSAQGNPGVEDLEEVFQILSSVPAGPDRDAAVTNVVAVNWVAGRGCRSSRGSSKGLDVGSDVAR